MVMMRRLFFIVLAAAFIWSGYWWVGQSAKTAAIEGWMAAQRQQGWVAEADEIRVQGFPNRFDTTLTDVTLADPRTRVTWQAPFFQILALSYAPNHIIAAWPQSQTVSGPFGQVQVDSRVMRASVRLRASTSLALEEARIELSGIRANSDAGWSTGLADGQLAVRAAPDAPAPNSYEIFMRASALDLPQTLRDQLDPDGTLPPAVGAARLRATAVMDAPLDRHLADDVPPSLVALTIDEAALDWGPLRLSATGQIEADADGYATGRIEIESVNWREQLRIARRSGVLPPAADSWANRLLTASEQAEGQDLSVTLVYRAGRTWIGPIPVGPAPRLGYAPPPPA